MEAAASEDQQQGEILVDNDSAVSNHQVAAEMLSGIKATVAESIGDQPSGIMAAGEAESLEFYEWKMIVIDIKEQQDVGNANARQTCFTPTASGSVMKSDCDNLVVLASQNPVPTNPKSA